MTVTLPPDLADLLARTGHRWPDADEDRLVEMADGWRNLQHELETARAENNRSTQAVLAGNRGPAVAAFGDWVRKFDGLLLKLVELCARAEAVLIAVARAVLAAKKAILTALAILAKAIAAAKYGARYIPVFGEAISELIEKVIEPFFAEARRVITEIVTKVADAIVNVIVPRVVELIRLVKDLVQNLRKLIKGRTGEDWPTNPSDDPHPDRRPDGSAKDIPDNETPENKRALRLENEAAVTLAQAGYDIEQLRERQGQRNPDYEIEGKKFDCYAPTSPKARNIWTNIRDDKISSGQTERVIININDPDAKVTVDALREQFQKHPREGLKEVKVIAPGGAIIDIYP